MFKFNDYHKKISWLFIIMSGHTHVSAFHVPYPYVYAIRPNLVRLFLNHPVLRAFDDRIHGCIFSRYFFCHRRDNPDRINQ